MAEPGDLKITSSTSLLRELIQKPNLIRSIPTSVPEPAAIPHDIDEELSDLENLIKKLQVEISEMTEMTHRPVQFKHLLNISEVEDNENESINTTSEDTKRIDSLQTTTLPNVSSRKSIYTLEETEPEEINVPNSNKNVNAFTRVFKNLFWDSSTDQPSYPPALQDNTLDTTENDVTISNTIQNDESSDTNLKLPEDFSQIDDSPENTIANIENEAHKVSDINKCQGTVRLGILRHIFGSKKQSDTSNKVDTTTEQLKESTDLNVNETQSFHIKTESSQHNIKSFSDTNIEESKDIQSKPSLEKSEAISEIINSQSDNTNNIAVLPCGSKVSHSLCNKSSQTLDVNNVNNLSNHNIISEHNVMNTIRTKLEEGMNYDLQDNKKDIPRRLSIVNMYVENANTKQDTEQKDSQSNTYQSEKGNNTTKKKHGRITFERPEINSSSCDSPTVSSDKLEIPEVTDKDYQENTDLVNADSSDTKIDAVDSDADLLNDSTIELICPVFMSADEANNMFIPIETQNQETEVCSDNFPDEDEFKIIKGNPFSSVVASPLICDHKGGPDEENTVDNSSNPLELKNVSSTKNVRAEYESLQVSETEGDVKRAINVIVDTVIDTKRQSVGNYGNENEDLTDEFESLADDSCSVESSLVLNVPKMEDISNGDNISDEYEDAEDS